MLSLAMKQCRYTQYTLAMFKAILTQLRNDWFGKAGKLSLDYKKKPTRLLRRYLWIWHHCGQWWPHGIAMHNYLYDLAFVIIAFIGPLFSPNNENPYLYKACPYSWIHIPTSPLIVHRAVHKNRATSVFLIYHFLCFSSSTFNSMASSLVFCSWIIFMIMALGTLSTQTEAARAFFVFGDSLVDNGNNNFLATTARADSPPYGIDFPPTHRPNGRFSNGYNIPDFICWVTFLCLIIFHAKIPTFYSLICNCLWVLYDWLTQKIIITIIMYIQVSNLARTYCYHTWAHSSLDRNYLLVQTLLLLESEFSMTLESSL